MISRVFLTIALFSTAACSQVKDDAEGAGQSSSSSSSTSTTTTVNGDGSTSVSTSTQSGNGSSSASSSVSTGGGMAMSEANDLYEFDYSWPAVAAIPGLSDELQKRMKSTKAQLSTDARESHTDAQANGYPFRPYSTSWEWKAAADTPRLLSLTADVATYMGGAHGNYGKDVLVWDRKAGAALAAMDLFISPAVLNRAISARFCRELDEQREERRGMAVNPNTPFGECPSAEDLEVIPGSSNGRTFDRIGLYAAPYVAGPYAEGDYEITLPVDEAILAAVKPQYRDAFAAMK